MLTVLVTMTAAPIEAPAPKVGECPACHQTVRQSRKGELHAHDLPPAEDGSPRGACPAGVPQWEKPAKLTILATAPKALNSRRRRKSQMNRINRRPWYRELRTRIRAGEEWCRNCGATEDLTIDHLVALSDGGTLTFDNVTVLCESCNTMKGVQQWPHLQSLADEMGYCWRDHIVIHPRLGR